MYEIPPILTGSEQQQIAALRDYLVRMARSLQSAENAPLAEASAQPGAATSAAAADAADARLTAGQLRSLVLKTAGRLGDSLETVRQNVESVDASLREDYLALSDFALYTEQAELRMDATARGVVESYAFDERIEALSAQGEGLDSALNSIRGEIRRGLITDPETGEQAMGIAISEHLRFTGEVRSADGLSYYVLSPGQTLGLYTATGWQFWINGSKRGWFDSADGMLHVSNLRAVGSVIVGAEWQLSAAGGFGIKYIGG